MATQPTPEPLWGWMWFDPETRMLVHGSFRQSEDVARRSKPRPGGYSTDKNKRLQLTRVCIMPANDKAIQHAKAAVQHAKRVAENRLRKSLR